jgi:two-component system sensor histidine kinase/response regulator
MRLLEKGGVGFDMALIDSDLPQSGARSLIRKIKAKAGDSARIIMMLTTTSTKAPARYDDADINVVVTKPIRPSDLLDAIVKAFSMQMNAT